jgi:hypothetical protein
MDKTIPHLIGSLRNVRALRTLLVDWKPATGYYASTYPDRQEAKFHEICQQLLSDKFVDRVVHIPYDEEFVTSFLKRNFQGKFNVTHCIRGYPIYGSIYPLFQTEMPFFVHFDSDMLLHQGGAESWISLGIDILEQNPDVLAVMPLAGPPTSDGLIFQGDTPYSYDPRGFHAFQTFSSRVYLTNVSRFRDVHPISPMWLGRRDVLRALWDGKGNALLWESMMSNVLQQRGLLRADLIQTSAWSLHPLVKDRAFLDNLATLISNIEVGNYPEAQAGRYDLDLSLWHENLLVSR